MTAAPVLDKADEPLLHLLIDGHPLADPGTPQPAAAPRPAHVPVKAPEPSPAATEPGPEPVQEAIQAVEAAIGWLARRLGADRVIMAATSLSLAGVAVFAGLVSYSHVYRLAVEHGQGGLGARLTPLSVDLLILAASLVLLWAARGLRRVPWPIRGVLIASVAATIAGNALEGLRYGVIGAVLSAWPGAAFVADIEIVMWLIRAARREAQGISKREPWWRRIPWRRDPVAPAESAKATALEAAAAAYARTAEAGNPLSRNQLQERFRLTRAEADAVMGKCAEKPAESPAA